jgi:hypothetical protein
MAYASQGETNVLDISNLFGREWIANNLEGTVEEFNAAFAEIPPTSAFHVHVLYYLTILPMVDVCSWSSTEI